MITCTTLDEKDLFEWNKLSLNSIKHHYSFSRDMYEHFQEYGYLTEIPRTYRSFAIPISEREGTRVTSRRIHHTAHTNVACIHYHSSRYGYRVRRDIACALLAERRAGCSCTRYGGISALCSTSLSSPPASYLDSSPDKQALLSHSPCVSPGKHNQAREGVCVSRQPRTEFGGLGSVGSVGPYRILRCALRDNC